MSRYAVLGRIVAALALAPAGVAGIAAGVAHAAPAQAPQAGVHYVVVGEGGAPLRGGASEHYYTIATLPAGTVLPADTDGQAWTRVGYPAGTGVYVRVEDVEVSGNTAKLTRPARVKAPQVARGYAYSWTDATPAPLPAGIMLTIVEPVRETEGGPIVAYMVKAPEQARGYVESRLVRRATEAEAEAFRLKTGAPAPAPAPVEPPKPTPAGPAAPGIDLTKPVEGPAPGQQNTTPPPPAPRDPADRAVGSVEDLEAAFQRVWKEPAQTAELDELIAEYQRAVDASGPGASPRKTQLERRIAALKLRKDIRERVRKSEEARAALDSDNQRLAEQLAAWERTRVYTIIGQLQPSTLYDGKRLPRMYRVVSVGAAAGRTLGYLRENESLHLDRHLGQVVGVIGEAQMDRSLRLNLIDAVRVDRLKAEDGKLAPAPASAADAPPKPTSPKPTPQPAAGEPEDLPD